MRKKNQKRSVSKLFEVLPWFEAYSLFFIEKEISKMDFLLFVHFKAPY